MTWSVRPSAFDFEGFLVDVDVTIQPLEEADTKGRGGTGGGGGPAVDLEDTGRGSGSLTAEELQEVHQEPSSS